MIFWNLKFIIWLTILTGLITAQAQFTWLYGYQEINPSDSGSYLQKNVEGNGNHPKPRVSYGVTIDEDGKYLYLFGGYGYGEMSDFWRFNFSSSQWTWLSGTSITYDSGVYGSIGQSSSSYYPSARQKSGLVYCNGVIYVFGGYIGVTFNEFWKYEIATTKWTWISGVKGTYTNTANNFGTLGVEASTNYPWGRFFFSTVSDPIGEYFYIFGGQASGVNNGNMAEVGDLWRYNINTGYWTWIGGSRTPVYTGNYTDKGIESQTAMPAARSRSLLFIDDTKTILYLFGGEQAGKNFNDLWKFNINTRHWTWISGNDFSSSPVEGTYGQLGVASSSNYPGSRSVPFGYYDQNCIYIYGGNHNPSYFYHDLWKFDLSINQWTALKGDSSLNVKPNFGTLGVFSTQNDPGSIGGSGNWDKNQKKFYLLADAGISPSSGSQGYSFNLWEMTFAPNSNPSTSPSSSSSSNSIQIPTFTWLYGYQNIDPNDPGSYIQQNVQEKGIYPKTRIMFSFTADDDGKYLYLFGGWENGEMSDLWRYTVSRDEWTWLSGTQNTYDNGFYGTKGQSSSSYYPSARQRASMVYCNGILYVFGGYCYNTFNELWKYDTTTQEWTWLSGVQGNYRNTASNFGTLGVESSTNMPWSRYNASMVCDPTRGYLYVFGGQASGVNSGKIDNLIQAFMAEVGDLWRYNIDTGYWTWIGGSSTSVYAGNYVDKGTASQYALPAARDQTLLLIDDTKTNLYIFGGQQAGKRLNDLWSFNINTLVWTWISGNDFSSSPVDGNYGQLGGLYFPGSRAAAFGYYDQNCIFILGGNYQQTYLFHDFWMFDLSDSQWTLLGGNSSLNVIPNFGTLGVSNLQNDPGSLEGLGSWAANQKTLYVMADTGISPTTGSVGYVFNLWEISFGSISSSTPSSNSIITLSEFKWLYEYNKTIPYYQGSYIQKYVEGYGNIPKARFDFGLASDDDGKYLYLFGGWENGALNDFWRFTTWLSGTPYPNDAGVYGSFIVGTSSGFYPSARKGASVVYCNEILYVFGGLSISTFNELWKYDTYYMQWSWISGNKGYSYTTSNYGTMGVESSSNMPLSRYNASMVCDPIREYLYVFGGSNSLNNYGNIAVLGDLWRYNINSGYWTWIGGPNSPYSLGYYINKGMESQDVMPASRFQTLLLIDDTKQYLFIFGGQGEYGLNFNDLWAFNTNTHTWAWISGNSYDNSPVAGIYGQIGVASSSIFPGSRAAPYGFYYQNCIYIYGGYDQENYIFDDLWKFDLSNNQWTLLKGNGDTNLKPNFGNNEQNDPGSIKGKGSWAINQKRLYMLIAMQIDPNTYFYEQVFDLWEMSPEKYTKNVSSTPNFLFTKSLNQLATTNTDNSGIYVLIYVGIGVVGSIILVSFSLIMRRRSRNKKVSKKLQKSGVEEKKPNNTEKRISNVVIDQQAATKSDPFDLENIAFETNIEKILEYRGEVGITNEEFERIKEYKNKHLIREDPEIEVQDMKPKDLEIEEKVFVEKEIIDIKPEPKISLPNKPESPLPNPFDLENIILETKIDKFLDFEGEGEDILFLTYKELNQKFGITMEDFLKLKAYKKKHVFRDEPSMTSPNSNRQSQTYRSSKISSPFDQNEENGYLMEPNSNRVSQSYTNSNRQSQAYKNSNVTSPSSDQNDTNVYYTESKESLGSNESLKDKVHIDASEFENAPLQSVIGGKCIITGPIMYGGRSWVRKGIFHTTGLEVAIKIHFDIKNFKNEAKMLKQFRHENIIESKDAFTDKSGLGCLILEWSPRTLDSFLKKARLTEAQIKLIGGNIVQGLNWIHSKSFIHGDIKPANICQDSENPLVWKLMDFDASTAFGKPYSSATISHAAPEVAVAFKKKTQILAAPSMDVWSLGVVFYEVITGCSIFPEAKDEDDILEILTQPLFEVDLSLIAQEQIRYACSKLLRVKPQTRDSISQFANSSFMKSGLDTRQQKAQFGEIKETLNNMDQKLDRIEENTELTLQKLSALRTTLLDLDEFEVPRMFIILPANPDNMWKKMTSLYKQQFNLHLLCEHPLCPHLTKSAGYLIEQPRAFIETAAPILALSCNVISIGLSVLAANPASFLQNLGLAGRNISNLIGKMNSKGLPNALPDTLSQQIKNFGASPLEYFKTIGTVLDQVRSGGKDVKEMTANELKKVSGPALRELQVFLDQHDQVKYYCGLSKYSDPETGHVYWLCPEHAIN